MSFYLGKKFVQLKKRKKNCSFPDDEVEKEMFNVVLWSIITPVE